MSKMLPQGLLLEKTLESPGKKEVFSVFYFDCQLLYVTQKNSSVFFTIELCTAVFLAVVMPL